MCDTWQATPEGEPPIRCVTVSDKCFVISLWCCYEPVIAWQKKRVLGTLEKFPTTHAWEGKLQPKDDEAKADAIGKMSWSQEIQGQKDRKHYFEPKPDPVVSDSEADLLVSQAGTSHR